MIIKYRDPNKFSQGYGNEPVMETIPGESDRDRRLRLRAMERKARLGSAHSNISAYSNPTPKEPPRSYQENVKFPDNTQIDTSFVKPASQMNFDERQSHPNYDEGAQYHHNKDYNEPPRNEVSYQPQDVGSSAETM